MVLKKASLKKINFQLYQYYFKNTGILKIFSKNKQNKSKKKKKKRKEKKSRSKFKRTKTSTGNNKEPSRSELGSSRHKHWVAYSSVLTEVPCQLVVGFLHREMMVLDLVVVDHSVGSLRLLSEGLLLLPEHKQTDCVTVLRLWWAPREAG